ncbi:MAG: NAD(P)-dependent oxidoreductase [Sumerlaeia bacterium]
MADSKAILVTGAGGFLGKRVCRRLLADGHTVHALEFREDAIRSIPIPEGAPGTLVPQILDLTNATSLDNLFEAAPIQSVIHLAAYGVRADRLEVDKMLNVNATATAMLAHAAKKAGIERFLLIGSGSEYLPVARPTTESDVMGAINLYGASKISAWYTLDYLRRMESFPLVTLRPFGFYGIGEVVPRLVPYVLEQAKAGQTMEFTEGTQIRDWLFVDDLVDAIVRALLMPQALGEVFNIGYGPSGACTVREAVETAVRVAGGDLSLAKFGAIVRERAEPPYFVCDPSKAMTLLKWRPKTGLREGLELTAESLWGAKDS